MKTYLKRTTDYDQAIQLMNIKNRAEDNWNYAVVPGPENDFAILDIATAMNLGIGYITGTRWVENPWN